MSRFVRSTDSKSLWNYTTSPGWTPEELDVLRLSIMRWGLGAWTKIATEGVLPGKTVAQLNNQVQRMVGQQSLGEFYGIKLDMQKVFEANTKKEGKRKNGCLVNEGANPTKETREKKQQENREKFGLTPEQIDELTKDELLYRLKHRKQLLQQLKSEDEFIKALTTLSKLDKMELLKKMQVEFDRLTTLKDAMKENPPKKARTDEPKKAAPLKKPAKEEEAGTIRCVCGIQEELGGDMIQCDKCAWWLHIECLKLENPELINEYFCPLCVDDKKDESSDVKMDDKKDESNDVKMDDFVSEC